MLSAIISKILAGAVVGYATNDLAIQMLFKEYFKIRFSKSFKFSMGGVIVKERIGFQQRISELVESDVIHHKALAEEMQQAHFKTLIRNVTQQFFFEDLVQAFASDLNLNEIEGAPQFFEALKIRLAKATEEDLLPLIHLLLEEISIDEILDEKQTQTLVNRFLVIFEDFFEHHPSTNSFIQKLLDALSESTLQSFLPEKTSQKLVENLNQQVQSWVSLLKSAPEKENLQTLIQALSSRLEVNYLLRQLAQKLTQKNITDLLGATHSQAVPKNLIQVAESILSEEVGEEIIQFLLRNLWRAIQQEKSTLFDLLSPEMKGKLEDFLSEKLPDLLETVIPWIRSKKEKLENLIHNAFKEQISALGKVVINVFIGNVGKFVGVESRIVELIQKQDVKLLAQQASEFALSYLRQHSIGDIAQKIQEDTLLLTLTPIVKQNIAQALHKIDNAQFQQFLGTALGNWLGEEKLQQNLRKLLDQWIEKQLQDNSFLQPNFIEEQIIGLQKTTFFKNQSPDKWKDFLTQLLKKQHDNIQKEIQKIIKQYTHEKHLSQWFPASESNQSALSAQLQNYINSQIDLISTHYLREYLLKIHENKNIDAQIADFIQSYLDKNLETLMKGRITALVYENLSKSPDEQLRGMVYKAMGEELLPINYFGALLGAITGGLLFFLPDFQHFTTNMVVAGTAYGITGWGTNWLAIKMLFRPHKPIRLKPTRYNLPFTPGVLAKNKNRFANSMGRFIGDRLLNTDNLQNNLRNTIPQLKQKMQEWLQKDNYQAIQAVIESNHQQWAKKLTQYLLSQYLEQPEQFAKNIHTLLEKQGKWTASQIPTESLEKQLIDLVHRPNTANQIAQSIAQSLQNWQSKQTKLQDLLSPNEQTQLLNRSTHWIDQQFIQIVEKLPHWVEKLMQSEAFQNPVQDFLTKKPAKILNATQIENITLQITTFLRRRITSPQVQEFIFQFIDEKLSQEFTGDKKIKDILGGKLIELFEENLNTLLQSIIQIGVKWMQNNKQELSDKVYDDARKQSILAAGYQTAIKNTMLELIDDDIPKFLNKEFISLQNTVQQEIERFSNNTLQTENLIALQPENLKKTVTKILQNKTFNDRIKEVAEILLKERIFNIPLADLLKIEATELIAQLRTALAPEINEIVKHLQTQLNTPKERAELIEPIQWWLKNFVEKHILPTPINHLLENISSEDLEQVFQKILHFLLQSNAVQSEQTTFVANIFQSIKQTPLEQLIDLPHAQNNIHRLLTQINQNSHLKAQLEEKLEAFFAKLFVDIPSMLPSSTKDFFLAGLSDALLKTLEKEIIPITQSIDFKKIVVNEIQKMQSEQLESLFYGFAGKYFKYLIGYGFIFGIIFGLGIDVGILGILSLFF